MSDNKSGRKPVTSLWHPEKPKPVEEPKEESPPVRPYDSPKARRPSKDHPWHNKKNIDRKMRYKLNDPRYNAMMAHLKMLVRELQQDPLYKVDCYARINKTSSITEVIRVGIKGKVYMKEKYLPAIAEKLGALLEKHHWKFSGSVQRLCGIDYYIKPDWEFWKNEKEEP